MIFNQSIISNYALDLFLSGRDLGSRILRLIGDALALSVLDHEIAEVLCLGSFSVHFAIYTLRCVSWQDLMEPTYWYICEAESGWAIYLPCQLRVLLLDHVLYNGHHSWKKRWRKTKLLFKSSPSSGGVACCCCCCWHSTFDLVVWSLVDSGRPINTLTRLYDEECLNVNSHIQSLCKWRRVNVLQFGRCSWRRLPEGLWACLQL